MSENRILVTGGLGYVGSHTVVRLQQSGYSVTILDNESNGNRVILGPIQKISGLLPEFLAGDIRDEALVNSLIRPERFDAIIHCAGLKAVGESVKEPLRYFDNNVTGSIHLLRATANAGIKAFIFSSSATVYGTPKTVPVSEHSERSYTNPYGLSKLMVEQIMEAMTPTTPGAALVSLRYFNPVGAHESGLIGENPNGVPNNIMPRLVQAAQGKLQLIEVFGDDYATHDGTCIRDYIHIMDLADGHLAALRFALGKPGFAAFNLGTGRGYSVLELIKTFASTNKIEVPYSIGARRPGDVPEIWSNCDRAHKSLNWRATRSLEEMCRHSWAWVEKSKFGK